MNSDKVLSLIPLAMPATSRCNRHNAHSTVHTSLEEEEKEEPNNRRYATPSMLHHAVSATALERSLHIERWDLNPRRSAKENNQSKPTAQFPRTNTPVRPYLRHPKPKTPIQRRTRRIPKVRKVCRFTHTSQVARKSSIVQHMEKSPNVNSNTLIDPVCCGSELAYPCCRHGRWSCARWSCPLYCVG